MCVKTKVVLGGVGIFLNGIHHQRELWLPDSSFVNRGSFVETLIPAGQVAIKIFSNGTVQYSFRWEKRLRNFWIFVLALGLMCCIQNKSLKILTVLFFNRKNVRRFDWKTINKSQNITAVNVRFSWYIVSPRVFTCT
jgi:hypothetical protein